MNALIIANGPLPQRKIVRKLAAASDVIVCADGGANHARAFHITPDVILGDLDSITSSTKKYFSRTPLLYIENQESTDLEKAISFCIQRKVNNADIVGALGERIDHATGSLGCFKRFRNDIQIRMYDRHGVLSLVDKQVAFRTNKGEKISLIPLERCTGITTQHLRYELKNETLELGVREGISNEAIGSQVSISTKKGTLLLYRFYGKNS